MPAGEGIVKWNEVRQGLKDCKFQGTISLHGEYEAKDLDERKREEESWRRCEVFA